MNEENKKPTTLGDALLDLERSYYKGWSTVLGGVVTMAISMYNSFQNLIEDKKDEK